MNKKFITLIAAVGITLTALTGCTPAPVATPTKAPVTSAPTETPTVAPTATPDPFEGTVGEAVTLNSDGTATHEGNPITCADDADLGPATIAVVNVDADGEFTYECNYGEGELVLN